MAAVSRFFSSEKKGAQVSEQQTADAPDQKPARDVAGRQFAIVVVYTGQDEKHDPAPNKALEPRALLNPLLVFHWQKRYVFFENDKVKHALT